MNHSYRSALFCIALLLTGSVTSATEPKVGIRVERLNERTIVLTEESPMENIVVAVASERGIVVVDATGSPYTARAIRERIVDEFGRDDFAYLVNTHHHWDHAHGNQAFAGAVIVGHEEVAPRLERDAARIHERAERLEQRITERRAELDTLTPGSEAWTDLRERTEFNERTWLGIREGFVASPPEITFCDRISLDLGDMTLEAMYFGRAHSGSDILIRIPEVGILMTGDLFLERGWLPLFAGFQRLDIDRWIETLDWALEEEGLVQIVIPGHRDVWPREKLVLWRDYIAGLWDGVRVADGEGLDREEIIARFPLDSRFDYLKEIDHDDEELGAFQRGNVSAFWRQLKVSAAEEVEVALENAGIDAALARHEKLRVSRTAYFDEGEYNAFGYRLLQSQRPDDAITIFKLNVDAYPQSWNVWDSLAEAYMTRGDGELAIEHYQKSIELNPDNANGKEMLQRLRAES